MPLPWKHNLADDETFPVKVFRDHPAWDTHSRWFNLPVALLNELHVGTYDVSHPGHLKWLEEAYPDHVFVY